MISKGALDMLHIYSTYSH